MLTWIGLLGTDRPRVFAAPDLRATWAILVVSGMCLVGLALLLIVHLSGIVNLILVDLLLIAANVFLSVQSRPLMWVMTLLLFLLAQVPGFGPALLILTAAGLFVCLRYLDRQSVTALYDPELQALSTVLGPDWKAYLPRSPDAQAQSWSWSVPLSRLFTWESSGTAGNELRRGADERIGSDCRAHAGDGLERRWSDRRKSEGPVGHPAPRWGPTNPACSTRCLPSSPRVRNWQRS